MDTTTTILARVAPAASEAQNAQMTMLEAESSAISELKYAEYIESKQLAKRSNENTDNYETT
jgi:hypothetical protein